MYEGCKKYIPFQPIHLPDRQWPDKIIREAPVWCSVDLRDGNQALIDPMNLEEKLLFFQTLVDIGFKEIEVGFPSASETEYEILRTLIERDLIPDDVTIQVLVQARPHLIQKTFEAIQGAKNVIVHFYNSTSTLQRKVVFKTDMQGVIDIAVEGAKLIKELTEAEIRKSGANIRFEYSPESFSGTEIENSVLICEKVMEALGSTPENKLILNLPNTVEMATPNCYADQIEYFCRHLKNRESAIISIHPHNDRGTATAATELGIMAGAERVEGTLFGNGERTGNADIMVVAMNMYSQGVDPKLDFFHIHDIREIYEKCTKMKVHERHPYAGDLVFTAFSGSHQDAIKKGVDYMTKSGTPYWEVPYLPINPADVGREYEPIIRINSQSGKGGAAFVMQQYFGYELPKAMHPEFGAMVKTACDETGRELRPQEIFDIFRRAYLEVDYPYNLKKYKLYEENDISGNTQVHFEGVIRFKHADHPISAAGNGPISAFFHALETVGIKNYQFVSYREHAISSGADSKAVSYIHLTGPDGEPLFGVGIDNNISLASIKGIICAINRAKNAANNSGGDTNENV
ncbi:2-isopropylmalate synthase [Caproiciproducens galactitolivorans]|uniref:2-isopropylmalate synthase n=1 Tax=Caproiciproducens galactitolivorans TaxID=642589 RepID=A0A4Z0XWT9_9FIRM|nr:2-isopropylmalate synthase [Caproiciproducens galactitolivorans]QEY34685.1 2-isopropylmalate synthase [Caproiciproducens galactitolivorans]TGJ75844.1 2-isopropylmalate synthase [Caproiciproducens galactitolivorans]